MASKKKRSGVRPNNRSSHTSHEQSMSILALILNIVILPGLGSIVGGKTVNGVWQIILYLSGLLIGLCLLFNSFSSLGIFFLIVLPLTGWVWGIVTGISLVRRAHG